MNEINLDFEQGLYNNKLEYDNQNSNQINENNKINNNPKKEENLNNQKHTELQIKSENKDKNQEKLFFWKFLIYNSKIEMNYDQFSQIIYWNGVFEIIFVVLSLISIFTISPVFVIFFVHLIRSIIGFVLICKLPLTHQVIENLSGCENESLNEISRKLTVEFRRLLEKTEESVKCLLITYFILSILGLLVDIISLIVLMAKMSMYENSAGYFLQMILNGLFLCNFFYLFFMFLKFI
jgi:hypothetical protein